MDKGKQGLLPFKPIPAKVRMLALKEDLFHVQLSADNWSAKYMHEFICVVITDLSITQSVTSLCSQLVNAVKAGNGT